jgi:hypothetical protein
MARIMRPTLKKKISNSNSEYGRHLTMRYDIHVRESARQKIAAMTKDMSTWEATPRLNEEEGKKIRTNIQSFNHTTKTDDFCIGGVDGSGDYPSFSYADSYVYVASASGTVYRTDSLHGLREEACIDEPTLEFVWLPGAREEADSRWMESFKSLARTPVRDVIERSDYRVIKDKATQRTHTVDELLEELILPRASDTANVGIQLRSTAELATAVRLITREPKCRYVLMDTTLSLPLARTKKQSLFYEHVKRVCCVEARNREVGFLAISKSHGMPAMELIERFAAEELGVGPDDTAEHWYLRLPSPGEDDWTFSLTSERQIPPRGGVSYLLRFHRNTPVLRLDMDQALWTMKYRDDAKAEKKLFGDLDYCGHDQRAYGYPYPIKACHDRARLSNAERDALKKQIIDAAVLSGMKRSLFRDVSVATGHL